LKGSSPHARAGSERKRGDQIALEKFSAQIERLFKSSIAIDGMSISPIVLSLQGLARAASVSESAFTFRGHGWEVECTSFEAAFISPRVHSLLQQDGSVDSLFVEFEDGAQDESRIFGYCERLMRGYPITPDRCDRRGLIEAAAFLQNTELLDRLFWDKGPITTKNVCKRLRRRSLYGRSMESEIKFSASHLDELNVADLKGLDISVVEAIVSSGSLRVRSEDSLADFILSLDSGWEVVIRYLHSGYLSRETMADVLNFFSDPDDRPVIWPSLCRRLLC
jgi:hypothetical protein